MKKVVLKLEILDERIKQKAMKNVSSLTGVDSISMDMKDKKLTVTGDIDPVTVVSKLRKICHTEILSVGPAKESEKKDSGGGAGGDKKKEDDKKKEAAKKKEEEALKLAYYNYQLQQYPYYNYQHNHPPTPYYSKVVHDDTPNCVIS